MRRRRSDRGPRHLHSLAIGVALCTACAREAPAPPAPTMTADGPRLIVLVAGYLVYRASSPYSFGRSNWLDLHVNPAYRAALDEQGDLVAGKFLTPPSYQWLLSPRIWDPFRNLVVWQLGLPLGAAAVAGLGLQPAARVTPVGVTELPECGTNDEVLAYHGLDVPGLVRQIGAAVRGSHVKGRRPKVEGERPVEIA